MSELAGAAQKFFDEVRGNYVYVDNYPEIIFRIEGLRLSGYLLVLVGTTDEHMLARMREFYGFIDRFVMRMSKVRPANPMLVIALESQC